MWHWYEGQLYNQQTIPLSLNDPGLLYGATVFTTLRVYEQNLDHDLTQWQDHCQRLEQSLQAFSWQQPNWKRLREGAKQLSAYFPVLRMTIFPDGREWITGRELPPDLAQKQQSGITAWLAAAGKYRRSFPTHKTGNYLSSWLALQTAKVKGAQEAILVDEAGNWLETSTGNLWGWKDGIWWTPSVHDALSGIARSRLISLLKAQNSPVQETVWTPEFVNSLEALGYSNCVVQVIPIHTVIR
ncbi:aminotransferase class IV [Halothece sp. PCC 7418]|uniref:aminotransferase class IV n=1 Tax=Halothece sp. (strain PCC 7418) TaxID=65093 RepID=UPI0002A073DC|nr:aminotransferase class IV [Halothece sp. PCC 7418]AFZ42982.1 aminotransferase class IV [Halothece sp. PCC 7418]